MAIVPMTVLLAAGPLAAKRLLPRFGPRSLMLAGGILTTVGLTWMSQLPDHSDYPAHILGPILVIGAGIGQARRTRPAARGTGHQRQAPAHKSTPQRPRCPAQHTKLSEVDTCKSEVYGKSYEALRAGMRHRQSPRRRRRTMEPPARAGADLGPAPLPRPRDRPAGHPQQRPARTPEGPAGRRHRHPAHPPGTHRRDPLRAHPRRPGAAARTQRAAGLGPALRTGAVPGRRSPARLGPA